MFCQGYAGGLYTEKNSRFNFRVALQRLQGGNFRYLCVFVRAVNYIASCFLVSALVLDRPMSFLFCPVDFHVRVV